MFEVLSFAISFEGAGKRGWDVDTSYLIRWTTSSDVTRGAICLSKGQTTM
jgi:hypothetical protein